MQDLLSTVFGLTKAIKRDPKRQDIQDCFRQLHSDRLTSGNIGYLGRHRYSQFFGYLLVHKHRDAQGGYPEKIVPLPEKTLELFSYGNALIKELNRRCLSSLAELIPGGMDVTAPYWEFDPKGEIDASRPALPPEADEVVLGFQAGKPFSILLSRLSRLSKIKEMKPEDVAKGLYSFRHRVSSSGLTNAPLDLFELSLKINANTPETFIASVLLSLLYIHSSLKCIDQLVFQAFLQDKLSCLNADNAFDFRNFGSNAIGDYAQLSTAAFLPFCGDIIVLDVESERPLRKGFCVIEQIEMNFSQDFGNEFKLGMRFLDKYCSPYGSLLRTIAA